jgi:serine/threonine-protein kinase
MVPGVADPFPPGVVGRYVPGATLGTRYRIVSALGKGGMGEVYLAHDLLLRQRVAVKFLPDSLKKDDSQLARLRNEVRLGREVSHPNVCRIYDIVEMEGDFFFTMEYIDGENLASLLRRIGRLSEEKAIEVAHQLCAGLDAIHAKGILHRDLKPQNIMLDGCGRVRITDFGLSAVASLVPRSDIRAGTWAYQAPEQRRGEAVTVQSDLYALGIILFELVAGLCDRSGGAAKARPADHFEVEGVFHPEVKRVIRRCLQTDPHKRPVSARLVAAALPAIPKGRPGPEAMLRKRLKGLLRLYSEPWYRFALQRPARAVLALTAGQTAGAWVSACLPLLARGYR